MIQKTELHMEQYFIGEVLSPLLMMLYLSMERPMPEVELVTLSQTIDMFMETHQTVNREQFLSLLIQVIEEKNSDPEHALAVLSLNTAHIGITPFHMYIVGKYNQGALLIEKIASLLEQGAKPDAMITIQDGMTVRAIMMLTNAFNQYPGHNEILIALFQKMIPLCEPQFLASPQIQQLLYHPDSEVLIMELDKLGVKITLDKQQCMELIRNHSNQNAKNTSSIELLFALNPDFVPEYSHLVEAVKLVAINQAEKAPLAEKIMTLLLPKLQEQDLLMASEELNLFSQTLRSKSQEHKLFLKCMHDILELRGNLIMKIQEPEEEKAILAPAVETPIEEQPAHPVTISYQEIEALENTGFFQTHPRRKQKICESFLQSCSMM